MTQIVGVKIGAVMIGVLVMLSLLSASVEASLYETPRGIIAPREIPTRDRFTHIGVPVQQDRVLEGGIPERHIFSGHPNDLKIVRTLQASGDVRGRNAFAQPEPRRSLIPLFGVEYHSPRQNVVSLPRGAIRGITGGWHAVCYCYSQVGR